MEPRIQYVRSADGTRIALWTVGRGQPLVVVPNLWLTTIEAQWQIPSLRENVARLAETRMVVLYDSRGQGSSQRDVLDLSLDRRVEDLSAVVSSLRSSPVHLMAWAFGGLVAIAHAAREPREVSGLVLLNPLARGSDFRSSPRHRALAPLGETDWELWVRTMALVDFGWNETGLRVGETMAAIVSSETMRAMIEESRRIDVTELLPLIRCPTLVIHDRPSQIISITDLQEMTATIPGAKLVSVTHELLLLASEWEILQIVIDFLDEDTGETLEEFPSGTAIILFADIVDSTALTERLGDAAFRDKARDLDIALRSVIREHSGTPIEGKLLGDGVLAVFTSARQAIEAALACGRAGDDSGLPLHLGLHAGDVIREENNVYGGAVNIASRISGLSAPGEVLVSDTIRALARTSAGVSFEDRGEHDLKGIAEPQRLFAVTTLG